MRKKGRRGTRAKGEKVVKVLYAKGGRDKWAGLCAVRVVTPTRRGAQV